MREIKFRVREVHIFSCGNQWLDWETRNCCNCKKSINQKEAVEAPFLCDIEQALNIASIDGMVPEDIAKRAGYDPEADTWAWACPEIEYTDEWKRERFEEEHQGRLFANNSATGAYNEKRTNVSKDKFKKLKDALAAYRGEK